MEKFALLLLMSTVLAVGFSAPTQKEELLAEIEGISEAEIEQKNLKELFGKVLDGANNYAQQKLNRGRPNTFRRLFGSVLDNVNNYAQHRLQKPNEQSMWPGDNPSYEATIEQTNLKELSANVLDTIKSYLRSKLGPEATIEQKTVKELSDKVIDAVTGYLRSKLAPVTSKVSTLTDAHVSGKTDENMDADEQALSALLVPVLTSLVSKFLESGNSDSSPFRQLFGSVLDNINNYAQHGLQQPNEQSMWPGDNPFYEVTIEQTNLKELSANILDTIKSYMRSKLGPEATIEQKTVKELSDKVIDAVTGYLRSKLAPVTSNVSTLTDAHVSGKTDENMDADEQALSALLVPVLTSLVSKFLESGNGDSSPWWG